MQQKSEKIVAHQEKKCEPSCTSIRFAHLHGTLLQAENIIDNIIKIGSDISLKLICKMFFILYTTQKTQMGTAIEDCQ